MTDDSEPTSPATPDPQPGEKGLDVEAEQERLDDLGRKITEVRTQTEKDMPARFSEDEGPDQSADDDERPVVAPHAADTDVDVDVDVEPDIEPDVDR